MDVQYLRGLIRKCSIASVDERWGICEIIDTFRYLYINNMYLYIYLDVYRTLPFTYVGN